MERWIGGHRGSSSQCLTRTVEKKELCRKFAVCESSDFRDERVLHVIFDDDARWWMIWLSEKQAAVERYMRVFVRSFENHGQGSGSVRVVRYMGREACEVFKFEVRVVVDAGFGVSKMSESRQFVRGTWTSEGMQMWL